MFSGCTSLRYKVGNGWISRAAVLGAPGEESIGCTESTVVNKLPGADTLYSEYYGPNGPGPYLYSAAAVRDRDYKYVRLLDGTEELYAVGPEALDEGPNLLVEPETLTDAANSAWVELSAVLDQTFAEL